MQQLTVGEDPAEVGSNINNDEHPNIHLSLNTDPIMPELKANDGIQLQYSKHGSASSPPLILVSA
jgi:hypothetical protein